MGIGRFPCLPDPYGTNHAGRVIPTEKTDYGTIGKFFPDFAEEFFIFAGLGIAPTNGLCFRSPGRFGNGLVQRETYRFVVLLHVDHR